MNLVFSLTLMAMVFFWMVGIILPVMVNDLPLYVVIPSVTLSILGLGLMFYCIIRIELLKKKRKKK